MKRMIAALVCLLLAVSLLAGCTPSEQKLLVGKWTGKADLAEAYETLLAKADPTLTGHIDIEDFQVELTLEFHESGTYQITADPEDLEAVTEAHQYLLDRLDKSGDSDITIQYTLNSGLMVTRTYAMNPDGGAGQMLKPYFSRWEYIFDTDNWYWVTTHVRAVSIERDLLDSLLIGDRQELDTHWYPAKYHLDTGEDPKLIMALLEAVRKDCDAGNLAQINGGGYIGFDTVDITVYYDNGTSASFQYCGKAVNTRPVVNDLFKQATPVTE